MQRLFMESPLGPISIEGDQNGIKSISFEDNAEQSDPDAAKVLLEGKKQLEEYFSGKRTDFSLKLSPEGTQFQQSVWSELEKLPFGQTTSYLNLAKKLGNPQSLRAVGTANGANPIAIVVPCHRVIGSDGKLTGYAGGLHRKKWLLEHEQKLAGGYQPALFEL